MCGYTETWSVPANDPASIAFYLEVFGHYLFNISNTSLWKITIEADNTEQFLTRGEPIDDSKDWPEGPKSTNNQGRPSGAAYVPFDIPWPARAPIAWRNEFDLATLFPDRLVNRPFTAAQAQALYNIMDCGLPQREPSVSSADEPIKIEPNPSVLIRLNMRFLMETEEGKQACLTLTTQNAMRYLLAPFGMTPCGDRSYICRSELYFDPAPSPPPPDNWQRPPSPPAFVYETITLASATGGSALFFLISTVCCFGIAGKHVRDRHNSRMIGVQSQRVSDEMPWRRKRWQEQGENHHDDVFRPDYTIPGEKLETGFSFRGLTARYNPVQQRQQ